MLALPTRLGLGLIWLVLAGASNGGSGLLRPKGTPLAQLDVIPLGRLETVEQQILIATLQGLIAKTSAEQIYIDRGGATTIWKNYLHERYGVRLSHAYLSWTSLVSRFQDRPRGYVLYETNRLGSINAATSLCGPLRAIAVSPHLEEAVRWLGITNQLADVRGRDDQWVYRPYSNRFNRHVAAELSHPYLGRDYAVLADAFTFYDGNGPFRTQVLHGLESEAFCFGYGDFSRGENVFVSQSAEQGVAMAPSDMAGNLAPLSSIDDLSGLRQTTGPMPASETNAHYVCFVTTDGDNIALNLWSLHQYWSNTNRG
jgi:hypothetical protein